MNKIDDYCKKDEDWTSEGSISSPRQGQRNDLEELQK